MGKLTQETKAEFFGQMINIFEDFLDEKNVNIPNEERNSNDENAANIYGSDYGRLCNELEELLKAWKLVNSDGVTDHKSDLQKEIERMRKKYETANPPISEGMDVSDYFFCPTCKEIVGDHDLDGKPDNYCSNCGTCLCKPKEDL